MAATPGSTSSLCERYGRDWTSIDKPIGTGSTTMVGKVSPVGTEQIENSIDAIPSYTKGNVVSQNDFTMSLDSQNNEASSSAAPSNCTSSSAWRSVDRSLVPSDTDTQSTSLADKDDREIAVSKLRSALTEDALNSRSHRFPMRLSEWTVDHVIKWMKSTPLPQQVADLLKEHAINGAVFESLSEEDLKSIGMSKLGWRRQLLISRSDLLQSFKAPPKSCALGDFTDIVDGEHVHGSQSCIDVQIKERTGTARQQDTKRIICDGKASLSSDQFERKLLVEGQMSTTSAQSQLALRRRMCDFVMASPATARSAVRARSHNIWDMPSPRNFSGARAPPMVPSASRIVVHTGPSTTESAEGPKPASDSFIDVLPKAVPRLRRPAIFASAVRSRSTQVLQTRIVKSITPRVPSPVPTSTVPVPLPSHPMRPPLRATDRAPLQGPQSVGVMPRTPPYFSVQPPRARPASPLPCPSEYSKLRLHSRCAKFVSQHDGGYAHIPAKSFLCMAPPPISSLITSPAPTRPVNAVFGHGPAAAMSPPRFLNNCRPMARNHAENQDSTLFL